MFWILYWQMYCWLAGLAGLAACCFCFLFPFPFSFHGVVNKVSMPEFGFQKGKKHSQKIGPKKVGPLYSLPPLLITWGSELTLFTTPLLITSRHYCYYIRFWMNVAYIARCPNFNSWYWTTCWGEISIRCFPVVLIYLKHFHVKSLETRIRIYFDEEIMKSWAFDNRC